MYHKMVNKHNPHLEKWMISQKQFYLSHFHHLISHIYILCFPLKGGKITECIIFVPKNLNYSPFMVIPSSVAHDRRNSRQIEEKSFRKHQNLFSSPSSHPQSSFLLPMATQPTVREAEAFLHDLAAAMGPNSPAFSRFLTTTRLHALGR